MKVLVCCYCDIETGGGGATLTRQVSRLLVKEGYGVSIISHAKNNNLTHIDGVPVYSHFEVSGVFWRWPLLVRERRIASFLRGREISPDIVFAVSPFYVNAAKKAWPKARIVYLFPCLLWRCLPFVSGGGARSFTDRFNHWLIGRSEKKALMSSDLTILQGPSVVEDVLSFVEVPREKLVVAPTGVDDMQQLLKKSRDEVRRYWNTPFSSRVFVTVGSLDRNKNQSAIIEAFSRLSDESAYLWIVGTGVMAADWEHYSAELGVAERVRFMGNRNDLADIYTAADVYVHAAWYDNFPNVYLEAMVCGLPLIGPRGEFPDVISPLDGIIEEKVHGVSYSLRQRDGLEGAMKYMLDRPEEELTEMGRRARVLALDAFSWEKYQSQLLQTVSMRNAEVIYES